MEGEPGDLVSQPEKLGKSWWLTQTDTFLIIPNYTSFLAFVKMAYGVAIGAIFTSVHAKYVLIDIWAKNRRTHIISFYT